MTYIFCDTETVSLDPSPGSIWDLGWAIDDEPADSILLQHSLVGAEKKALEVGNYWHRMYNEGFSSKESIEAEEKLKDLLGYTAAQGPLYLVGANPAFDRAHLKARWNFDPFHFRMICVEVHAMGALGLDVPQSLTKTASLLRDLGHEIPENQHTAKSDVECTRAVFRALQKIYRGD